MKSPLPIEVSQPRDQQEQEILAEILSRSLFFPPLSQMDWIPLEGPEHLRVVREQGKIRGGLSLHSMGQWFAGSCLSTGAVRCVGIAPEARSRGLATHLLQACLQEMYERNMPISTLYPATQPVYRRAGYEQAGLRISYAMPLHAIACRERSLRLEPHDPSDIATFQNVYQQHARRTSGHLERTEWAWKRLQRPASPQQPVHGLMVYDGEQPVGYLWYAVKPPTPGERFAGEIHIKDWVSLTPQATDAMWTFLADHRSVNDTVRWNGAPNDPKLLRIDNQSHEVSMLMIWVLRLVNVRTALEQRTYPSWLDAEIHLNVIDPICPWNQGRWICAVSGGQAHVTPGGHGHITLPIQALASLYAGFFSPWELMNAYTMQADATALPVLAAMFAGPTPWMPDMF